MTSVTTDLRMETHYTVGLAQKLSTPPSRIISECVGEIYKFFSCRRFHGCLRVTTDSFYCSTESESDQDRTSDTDYEMYQTEDKEN